MKTQLFASVIAVGAALSGAQAQDIDIVNSPSFTRETDRALSAACPNPILQIDDRQASVNCVYGTMEQAVRLSDNMADYVGPFHPILQGDLLRCRIGEYVSKFSNHASFERYLNVTVGAAVECIESFDRVVREFGVNLEQDSRNLIVDQLNCFKNPRQCRRLPVHDKI